MVELSNYAWNQERFDHSFDFFNFVSEEGLKILLIELREAHAVFGPAGTATGPAIYEGALWIEGCRTFQ